MIFTYTTDPRIVHKKNLDDTSFQTLVACESKEVKTLESMSISCGDTGCNFWLSFNDGTNDFFIYNKRAMAANSTIFVDNFHPKLTFNNKTQTSSSFQIKASAANQISVVAVMIDHLPVKDNQTFQGVTGGQSQGYNGGGMTGGQMSGIGGRSGA